MLPTNFRFIWPSGFRGCHHLASTVCRPLTFHILIFSSETPQLIIWPWGQRLNEGHYGMWHPALWSCTHIPRGDISFRYLKQFLLVFITFIFFFSSPCQRQSELLPSLGVHRLSSVNFPHFNLLPEAEEAKAEDKIKTKTIICLPSFKGET
jgi:hypothetical protein